jgi:hypothetical protein
MIEIAMGFAMGFLSACLLIVVVIPLVHARAVRLTARSVLQAVPLSLIEVEASKDLLRAEFAMSRYRLDRRLEAMRIRATDQLAEIGRKTAEIARLEAELGRQSARVLDYAAREQARRSNTPKVAALLGLFARSDRRRVGLHSGQGRALPSVEAPPLQNSPGEPCVLEAERVADAADGQPARPATAGTLPVCLADRSAHAEFDAALNQMMVAIAPPPPVQRSLN